MKSDFTGLTKEIFVGEAVCEVSGTTLAVRSQMEARQALLTLSVFIALTVFYVVKARELIG